MQTPYKTFKDNEQLAQCTPLALREQINEINCKKHAKFINMAHCMNQIKKTSMVESGRYWFEQLQNTYAEIDLLNQKMGVVLHYLHSTKP